MGLVKNRQYGFMNSAIVIPAGTTVERPDSPVFGQVRLNVDIGKLEYFDGNEYAIVAKQGEVEVVVDSYTGDAVTVVFGPMHKQVSNPSNILVFIGNVYQEPNVSYTVNGTHDITFVNPPPNGMRINIIHNFNSTEVV